MDFQSMRPMTRRSLALSNAQTDPSDKENQISLPKVSSSKQVEQFLNGVRVTAMTTITNVKSSFEGFSQKLKGPMKKTRSLSKMKQYKELGENTTPVKLYSPFSFVTPSPPKDKILKKRTSPRRMAFKSPTGTFRQDVQQLNRELQELEKVEKSLYNKKMR